MQLQLTSPTSDRSKTIQSAPVARLDLSRFNTRRTRLASDVEKLAERIGRLGFEITRAPWVYPVGDHFEVFAGGTRVEAARVHRWVILDLRKLVGHWARSPINWSGREKSNDRDADGKTGSSFVCFSTSRALNDIDPACVVACSEGYFEGEAEPGPATPAPAWLTRPPVRPEARPRPAQGRLGI